VTQHWNKHDFVLVDTSNILFICAGTFTDLPAMEPEKIIGFKEDLSKKARRQVTQKELMEYGLIPELLGRLPVMVQLNLLTEDELVQILCDPPDSVLREFTELLAMDEITLELTDDAKRAVVRSAQEKRLGARGLRGIIEDVLRQVMFEAPERRGQTVKVDERFVRDRLEQLKGDRP
jgi:ATP-dependent Clp protease ATP-binding subunit ClpX